MPAAAWLFKHGADMTGRTLTCVDVQHCTCAHAGFEDLHLIMCVCLIVCVPLSHLYFSHHVVVRLHVHDEGLSHLSLTVVEDLDLHKVFLLTLLELNILETQAKRSEERAKRSNLRHKIATGGLELATKPGSYPLTAGCSPPQRSQSRLWCAPSPLRPWMCLRYAG